MDVSLHLLPFQLRVHLELALHPFPRLLLSFLQYPLLPRRLVGALPRLFHSCPLRGSVCVKEKRCHVPRNRHFQIKVQSHRFYHFEFPVGSCPLNYKVRQVHSLHARMLCHRSRTEKIKNGADLAAQQSE